MNVYVLEQGVDGVSSEVVGVVSNEDVARLFCSTNPKERMYTQKPALRNLKGRWPV